MPDITKTRICLHINTETQNMFQNLYQTLDSATLICFVHKLLSSFIHITERMKNKVNPTYLHFA